MRVVHHGLVVVVGERAPVLVFVAAARLGPGVLVAEAEHVTELVPQDAHQGRLLPVVTEARPIDEHLLRGARAAWEESPREVGLEVHWTYVEDHALVRRIVRLRR